MASATRNYDCLVFGGGLAGSILAHTLISQGIRPLVIDYPQRSSCSRVAAGLINPIGGRRLNPIWQAEALIPFARSFYKALESSFQSRFFHPRQIVRLFASEEERAIWERRKSDSNVSKWTQTLNAATIPEPFATGTKDGFAIPDAGYLDTGALIEALKERLMASRAWEEEIFEYKDIELIGNRVRWKDCDAPFAVFCDGHWATENPWFRAAPFKPAKGVIGSIVSDIYFGQTAVIKKFFIIPRHDGSLQVGATYNWEERDDEPDTKGIQELEAFLNDHLGKQWQWKELRAGVRPATAGAKPMVGPASKEARILSFNGFGSKGAVQIPYFAQALCDYLKEGAPLPCETLPARFSKDRKPEPKRWVAVEIARDRALKAIREGDWVVDATAGNGHDTLWLARKTGPSGRVFAFDIQYKAIAATKFRLESEDCAAPVALIKDSHENLRQRVPGGKTCAAVVFNLGYLPGSDKSIITQSVSTLSALKQSLEILSLDGLLSVVLYPGHRGGDQESDAVIAWAETLDTERYGVEIERHPTRSDQSPFVLFVTRKA